MNNVSKLSPPELAQEIRRLIQSGEFKAGDHLGTVELASRFGVSRGPVREALRLLESRHLVRVLPQQGAFVTALAAEEAQEVMEIREVLFGRLAELTAERADPEQLAAIDERLANLDRLAQAPDTTPHAFQKGTYDYIGIMYQAARSPRLVRMIRDMTEGLGNMYGHLSMATRDMRLAELKTYQVLTKALKDRDPMRAGQQARRMHSQGVARARELQTLMPPSGDIVFKGRRRRQVVT